MTIPTLEDIEDSKLAMDDIQSITYSPTGSFVDAKGVTRKTINGLVDPVDAAANQGLIDIADDVGAVNAAANQGLIDIADDVGAVNAAADGFDAVAIDRLNDLDAAYVMTAINNGVWANGEIFTAVNQYMVFSGTAYKPKNSTTLPYVVGVTPVGDGNVEVVGNLSVAQGDGRYSRKLADLASALSDVTLSNGNELELKVRSTGNGGGGTWDVYPSGTFPVGLTIFDVYDHDSLPLQLKFRPDVLVGVQQLGVIGDTTDGTDGTDDTEALRFVLNNYPSVRGQASLKVRTTEPIVMGSECYFKLMGMTILGQSIGDADPWFYIRSSDVFIERGKFGDGTVDFAKAIVVGDYDDAELFLRNIKIRHNRFTMSVLDTQQAVVSGHGRVFELTIEKNRFQSTHTYIDSPADANTAVNNIAAIFMQNGGATLGEEANQDWDISKNRCINFPYLFNNQSVGVTSGVKVQGNITSGGMMGLRVYHIYDCIVDKNIWTNCIDTQHIWQRTTYTKNKFTKCGQLTPFNRPCFKVEAGTSLNISGNEMRESLGDGALIDGGNSDFSYGPNNIHYKSGGAGLRIRAPGEYTGQITGLGVSDNRFVENAEEAIVVEVTSAIRGLHLVQNHMAANGLNNAGDVAAILFNNPSSFAINDVVIAFNTIRNNDVVGGVQTAKTKWAVKFEQPGATYAEYLIAHNITHTELLVADNRTSGGGTGTVFNNFTLNITDPQLVGMVWNRNFNRLNVQESNRRTGFAVIGVLTPLYLGEEVFSTSEQDWYKGIGLSAGPWTNTDWKLMT